MSKSTLRKDKTCLNCRHVVDQRFCPNCGQENTESRKTFHHLFIHFFEDLTHYENAFWRTIKNLLFRPSALTTEYLSGRRLSYLAPVRLYIFISFITFFLITVIPNPEDHLLKANQTITTPIKDKNGVVIDSVISTKKIKVSDAIKMAEKEDKTDPPGSNNYYYKSGPDGKSGSFNFGYYSLKELDSMQKFGPQSEKINSLQYWFIKKSLIVKEHNTTAEIIDKFKESFIHNIPKVLFIYMPIFAFFLWLFHGKKRWYFFDHGIFTLHYFSFLLLILLFIFIVDWLLSLIDNPVFDHITTGIDFVTMIWMFYYFFPAHHRFYGESRIISLIKSIALFFINCVLIFLILILFALYTFINIH